MYVVETLKTCFGGCDFGLAHQDWDLALGRLDFRQEARSFQAKLDHLPVCSYARDMMVSPR